MTVEEIQRVLRTLHRESLERSAAIRDREPDSDADWLAIFAAMDSSEYVKPAPGRTTMTLAGFSFEEQEQIEAHSKRLINEAHALCLGLQERCPTLREGDIELFPFERWYRAQGRAMERLKRRRDDWHWIHAHIMKARNWLAATSAVRGLTARAAQARTDERIRLLVDRNGGKSE